MKKLIITMLIISAQAIIAQNVKGKITINGDNKTEIDLESPYVVTLFKSFRDGKNKIIFFYEGADYAKPEEEVLPGKPKFDFFKFKTTVKHNGKTINSSEREPMPYIPGGMFLAPETFSFVPVLGRYLQDGLAYQNNTGRLAPGQYEIILEAIPVESEGEISRGLIVFNVE
ncbi:hypothetical protein OO013_05085 [Mangrovivirga sp. M17]|uniref:Uncharacterized protein n=1 Tax=Mangrovivirga halotolerans TaxID=2993936 RepID=A0ABT3RPN7_9BACT|nr:hypothetical protein [Mangrovivirga halotolerans]MCX2743227.1 hypothetical protein [Mangrovivirga halotolerans]